MSKKKMRKSLFSEQKLRDLLTRLHSYHEGRFKVVDIRKKADIGKMVICLNILNRDFEIFIHVGGMGGRSVNRVQARSMDIRMSDDMSLIFLRETIHKHIAFRYAGYLHEDNVLRILDKMKEKGHIQGIRVSSRQEDIYGFDVAVLFNEVWIPFDITTNIHRKREMKKADEEKVSLDPLVSDARKKNRKGERRGWLAKGPLSKKIPLLSINFANAEDSIMNYIISRCHKFLDHEEHPQYFMERLEEEMTEYLKQKDDIESRHKATAS